MRRCTFLQLLNYCYVSSFWLCSVTTLIWTPTPLEKKAASGPSTTSSTIKSSSALYSSHAVQLVFSVDMVAVALTTNWTWSLMMKKRWTTSQRTGFPGLCVCKAFSGMMLKTQPSHPPSLWARHLHPHLQLSLYASHHLDHLFSPDEWTTPFYACANEPSAYKCTYTCIRKKINCLGLA